MAAKSLPSRVTGRVAGLELQSGQVRLQMPNSVVSSEGQRGVGSDRTTPAPCPIGLKSTLGLGLARVGIWRCLPYFRMTGGLGLRSRGDRGNVSQWNPSKSQTGEVGQLIHADQRSMSRMGHALELDSPAGGLGGPAPPVKEWVTRSAAEGLTQSARLRDDDPKRSGGKRRP